MKRAAGAALLEHPNQYAPLLGLPELRQVRLCFRFMTSFPLHHLFVMLSPPLSCTRQLRAAGYIQS